jgi:hypothetical protein
MNDYYHLHRHQAVHNTIVRAALRRISRESKVSYQFVQRDFIDGVYEVTDFFWEIIRSEYNDIYDGVYYCQSCRKFFLTEKEK